MRTVFNVQIPLIVLLASAIIYPILEIVLLVILPAALNVKQLMHAHNVNQLIRFQVQLASLVTFLFVKAVQLIMYVKLVIIMAILHFPPALLEALAFNAVALLIVSHVQPTICVEFV